MAARLSAGVAWQEDKEGAANAKFQELLDQCCSLTAGEEEEEERQDSRLLLGELEARAAAKFNTRTFFKELFYHVFFPLSVPLMWSMEGGLLSLINRGFYPKNQIVVAVVQLVLASCFYCLNIISFIYIVSDDSWNCVYDVALVDILWILRNSVVATKYAFTAEVEMREMRTTMVPGDVHTYRTLLQAWRDPIPKQVLQKELFLAAARCRMLISPAFRLENAVESREAIQDMIDDLSGDYQDTSCLNLCKEAQRWLTPSTGTVSSEVALTAQLPVHLYAAHILWQSSSLSRLRRVGHTLLSQHLLKCSIGLGLFHGVMPAIGRAVFGGRPFPGPPWTRYFVAFCSGFLIAFNMWSNVAFMMVGVLDFRRRHYVAEKLDELLTYGVYSGERDGVEKNIRSRSSLSSKTSRSSLQTHSSTHSSRGNTALSGPGIVVDFTDSDSLSAWWMCRQLVQNFGLSFHKRIKFYTTYFACYCGILLFYVGLRLFTGINREDLYILITITFSIYVFLFLLALMVWPGGDINLARLHHGATLSHQKLSLQRKIRTNHKLMTPEEFRKARTAVEMMTSIAEAVKWDNAKIQVSICGFDCGEQLISAIVAIITASISIGVGQIAQNGLS